MLLQKLLWNNSDEYGPVSLYFREDLKITSNANTHMEQEKKDEKDRVFVSDSGSLQIHAGTTVSFDTYFNLFSVSKWQKYTKVQKIGISAALQGKGTISLIPVTKTSETGAAVRYDAPIKMLPFENDVDNLLDLGEFSLEDLAGQMDYLFITVEAGTNTTIQSIEISTAEEYELSNDALACCICTFKREKELARNIDAIKHDILENRISPLYGKLKVFISDNGHTLENQYPGLGSEDVMIFENPNYGGSGGFTRGMIESIIRWKGDPFGYCILMDDDIILYPQILVRAYSFLSALKECYQSAFLEGTHMLVEEPSKAYEGKLTYSREKDSNIYKDIRYYDFSERDQLWTWNRERTDNIYGWWFTCIPAHLITESNLPLPLFFQLDDYEFGTRNKAQVILMNGVGVWHPNPVGKQPFYTRYYIARNNLMMAVSTGVLNDISIKGMNDKKAQDILDASGGAAKKKELSSDLDAKVLSALRSRVSRNFWGYTWRYQYDDLEMLLKGYIDFFQGPDYFKKIDPEELHKRLMGSGKTKYQNKPMKVPEEIKAVRKSPKKKMIRYILPARGTLVVSKRDISSDAATGFKKIVIVDSEDRYYVVKKDLGRSIILFSKYLKLMHLIDKNGYKIWNKWKNQIGELRSYKFWESYLSRNMF